MDKNNKLFSRLFNKIANAQFWEVNYKKNTLAETSSFSYQTHLLKCLIVLSRLPSKDFFACWVERGKISTSRLVSKVNSEEINNLETANEIPYTNTFYALTYWKPQKTKELLLAYENPVILKNSFIKENIKNQPILEELYNSMQRREFNLL